MSYYRIVSDMLSQYVLREVDRRFAAQQLRFDQRPLQLRQFRVIFKPNARGTIVELNEEVEFTVQVETRHPIEQEDILELKGIYPHRVKVVPPEVDGQKCAYFYTRFEFVDLFMAMDCRRNLPGNLSQGQDLDDNLPWDLAKIAYYQHYSDTVKPLDQLRRLADVNWPPAPSHFPTATTYAHRTAQLADDNQIEQVLIATHSEPFWESRLEEWHELGVFPKRLKYVRHAINEYLAENFISCVYVLVPQIEGIITSYLGEAGAIIPNQFRAKVDMLKNTVFSRAIILFRRNSSSWLSNLSGMAHSG